MGETPIFGHAAVTAPHWPACETGLRILAQGGNAVEAMVAMSATIAVTYPHMNSIGGDAFWLVAERGRRVHFLDACGAAGAKATIKAYRTSGYDAVPAHGPLAALTVPGAVSGWRLACDLARARGGTLPLGLLLEDAIRLAREGFAVSSSQARVGSGNLAQLLEVAGFRGAFTKDGALPPAGETMRQQRLADTLEQLAHAGLDDFYRGDVAREIAADLDRLGSPIAREDLRRHAARVREPLTLRLDGVTLFNAPPPTAGVAALFALGVLERLGVTRPESFEHIHGLVEALKPAIALREQRVTDPAFIDGDPQDWLATSALDEAAAAISMRHAAVAPSPRREGGTIWMGAIDGEGLAVSAIQSIYWDFGSGLVLPRTGVLMQNRGVSFSLDPADLNPLAPGRRPPHTLIPAMALFDDGRVMPYGTRGGEAQPQFQAQIFSRYRLGMGLADAIDAPRFRLERRAGDDEVRLSLEPRFDDALVRALARAGHTVVVTGEAYSERYGQAGALVRHVRNGRIEAVHDPRGDGGALGL
jgi:gamma-glutamyltranspeptidase